MTTAAVVLAAGGARRWRGTGHKLLAPFRGRPLVCWAVDHALAAGLDETVVVTGAASLEGVLPPGLSICSNPGWAQGQAGSLQVALAHARGRGHDAMVVGLGDQPLIPPSAWTSVAAGSSPITVATYEGRRGNPVRLAAAVWDLLPTAGDAGARLVMAERPALVGEVACVGDPVDIDTVEDLARWS